ncbi:MAG: hypothetical protein Tsb0020_46510 [Haliangiales bacterium]
MQQSNAASTGWAMKVGLVLAGLLLLLVISVGALATFGYFLFVDQVEDELAENPVIQEHLGTIEELSIDLVATGEYEDDNVFVFDVTGDRGRGRVAVESVTVDADSEEIVWGVLELSSGEEVSIAPLDR